MELSEYFCFMNILQKQLFELLEEKADFYNTISFIDNDPICIPHLFTRKQDIEIAGFLSASLAWGQRTTIISKARDLMQRMENSPYEFITNGSESDFSSFESFVHRTFQTDDCIYFLTALRHIYLNCGGLENIFTAGYRNNNSIKHAITHFRTEFFSFPHLIRTRKHISDPANGSAAKRINMFLRWMVRNDDKGVDFGIWKNISQADLMCPLDLHSGRVARTLGLLSRKQDDWTSVEELTAKLRTFAPADPVKYDFALFGTGVNEKYNK